MCVHSFDYVRIIGDECILQFAAELSISEVPCRLGCVAIFSLAGRYLKLVDVQSVSCIHVAGINSTESVFFAAPTNSLWTS